MRHAGPSITITSFTDALAFLAGASSSIPGISSFCAYSAFSVMMLYIGVMTIFLSIIYWDTWRVSKRYGECCGLIFCKEDSILFCKGKLLSNGQKVHSRILNQLSHEEQALSESTEVIASNTEKFLLERFVPILLGTKVKAFVLIAYALFTAFCTYHMLEMKTYYSSELTIDDDDYSGYEYIQIRN